MNRRARRIALIAIAVCSVLPSSAVVIQTSISGNPVAIEDQARSPLWYFLGTSPKPALGVVGKDGWIFYGDLFQHNYSQATGQRTYSDAEIQQFAYSLGQQKAWLARRGIPLIFVIAPAKWEIYGDKLKQPLGASNIPNQITEAHPELGLVDVRQPLKNARSVADTYSKLNGHWTDYGGYIAWKAILSAMRGQYPALTPADPPPVASVSTTDLGNEYKEFLGLDRRNSWTSPILANPLPDVNVVQPDGSTKQIPGSTKTDMLQLPLETLEQSATGSARLLMLGDSTISSLSPYMQTSFANVLEIRHFIDEPAKRPSLISYVEKFKPTVVMYVMTERYLDIGLKDAPLWAAANAYDQAGAAQVGSWSGGTGQGLAVSGNPGASPSVISFAGSVGSASGKLVVRVAFTSKSESQLQLTIDGEQAVALPFAGGESEQYFQIDNPKGKSLKLSVADQASGVQINSITVKSLGK